MQRTVQQMKITGCILTSIKQRSHSRLRLCFQHIVLSYFIFKIKRAIVQYTQVLNFTNFNFWSQEPLICHFRDLKRGFFLHSGDPQRTIGFFHPIKICILPTFSWWTISTITGFVKYVECNCNVEQSCYTEHG